MQKALERLARSGLVLREHGRGTFVAGTRIATADVSFLRFRDAAGRELPNFMHLRSVRRVKRKGPWSEFLGEEPAYVRIDLQSGTHAIEQATGQRPRYFRAPHGFRSPWVSAIARELGQQTVGWTLGVWDSDRPGAAAVRRRPRSRPTDARPRSHRARP